VALLHRSVITAPGHVDRAPVLGAVLLAVAPKRGLLAIALQREAWRHGLASLAVMPRKHVTPQVPTIGGTAERWIFTASGPWQGMIIGASGTAEPWLKYFSAAGLQGNAV
jgi:hypothetical protein